jgi:hypothetical protein
MVGNEVNDYSVRLYLRNPASQAQYAQAAKPNLALLYRTASRTAGVRTVGFDPNMGARIVSGDFPPGRELPRPAPDRLQEPYRKDYFPILLAQRWSGWDAAAIPVGRFLLRGNWELIPTSRHIHPLVLSMNLVKRLRQVPGHHAGAG